MLQGEADGAFQFGQMVNAMKWWQKSFIEIRNGDVGDSWLFFHRGLQGQSYKRILG